MNRLTFLALGLAVLLSTGCVGHRYINIPPLEEDHLALNDPNITTVRNIEIAAISYSLEKAPIQGRYAIDLPDETNEETYAIVLAGLGDAAVSINDPAANGLPTLDIRGVRIRGIDGEVDIVRPDHTGRRLSTVYLIHEMRFGWAGQRIRPWMMDPDKDPTLNPPPPVEPTPAEQPADESTADELMP